MRFTLYPIYWVADPHLDPEPFDNNLLPFDITENVRIESLVGRFRPGTFALGADRHGTDIREELESVRYALVHRYDPQPVFEDGEYIGDVQFSQRSETLVRELMACLRLIRPMRARALVMRGNVRDEDGTFDITGYDVPPLHMLEVPEVQKLFKLRNQDCHDLRRYAPEFLRAMRGGVWKFKMAVQFHDLGHFQCLDWKARCLLWASAIESIFTTNSRNHQGTAVATERIKWFLGANTSIYAPGDLNEFEADPRITVGDIVDALYNVRNHLAHGDRIPDLYFLQRARDGLNGGVVIMEVLVEAASFIIRSSLLKILRDGLTNHFMDASAAEAYFDANSLTNSKIRARQHAAVLAVRP
jgi:hypothetical protein